jgi:hypothetical protein
MDFSIGENHRLILCDGTARSVEHADMAKCNDRRVDGDEALYGFRARSRGLGATLNPCEKYGGHHRNACEA